MYPFSVPYINLSINVESFMTCGETIWLHSSFDFSKNLPLIEKEYHICSSLEYKQQHGRGVYEIITE